MLAAISIENHHAEFKIGKDFKDHLFELFREQSSVDSMRFNELD